jgi:hypothetical protein
MPAARPTIGSGSLGRKVTVVIVSEFWFAIPCKLSQPVETTILKFTFVGPISDF